ncbi:MAG: hypothetical protein FWD84_05440, partial [Oscillospiraceae bacterium]|nr:hypothetical protein [Oscillospiraceae bacterium]
MYFAQTQETRFAFNQEGQLTYQLPTDLFYVQAADPMPIGDTDGYGWYAIDEYGLITVWFDDLQVEQIIEVAADNLSADESTTLSPSEPPGNDFDAEETVAPMSYLEHKSDITFALLFEVVALDTIFPGDLDFGNGFVLGLSQRDFVTALSVGDPSDLAYFITDATMWTQDAGGNWIQVLPGTAAYIGQTYRFDIRFSEGDTADEQFAYNANGFLTYQLPVGLTIQNAVDWTPIRLPNNNIVGQYRISSTGFVELFFNNVDANGNPRPSNFIDDPQAFFTLQIFAQFNGDNLDFGEGGIITVVPTPPPPQIAVNKTSRYDPDGQRIYYTITITALGGSVTNIGLTDTPTVNGGTSISNPVTNDAFSAPMLQVTRFDNTVTPPVAILPPVILQTPSVTWPSRNPASFQIDLLRNDDGTPLVLAANEFVTLTFYLDIQKLIANNLTTLSPSTTAIYNFSIENTVGVISSVNPAPVTDNAVDNVRRDLPITKSGTLITADDGTPQSIRWTTIIGDGRTTLLNSVQGGAGYTGGNVTDTLGDLLTTTPIVGGLAGISLTFTSFNPAAPAVPIVRTINASQVFPSSLTSNGFNFVVPSAGTMLTYVSPVQPYYNVYQITMVYYTDITGAMQGVGSAGRMFTNTATFEGVPAVANVPVRPGGFTLTKSTVGLCGSMDAAAPNVGPNGERYFIDYEIRLGVPANMQGQPIYLYDIFGVWPGNTGAPNSVNGVTGQNAAFSGVGGPGAGVFAAPAGIAIPDLITDGVGGWQALDHYVSGGGAINAWSMFFGTGSTTLANNSWPFDDARIVVIRYRLWISEGTYGPSTTTNLLGRLESQVTPFADYVQNVVYLINDHAGPQIWPPAGVNPNFILGV